MIRTTSEQGHAKEGREEKLFEVADRQAGYFTAKQALETGYGYPLQHYHRERGHWVPAGHGLFRLRRYPEGENEPPDPPLAVEPQPGGRAPSGGLP